MKIFKYILQITDKQVIEMPEGAVLLSVQFQNGQLCVWAEVDGSTKDQRTFWIVGTGHSTDNQPCDAVYLGTVQQHGGQLVWHVFAQGPKA